MDLGIGFCLLSKGAGGQNRAAIEQRRNGDEEARRASLNAAMTEVQEIMRLWAV